MRLEWEIYAAADGSHDGLDEGVTGIQVHRRQRNTSHAEENATLRTMKHQHVVVIDVPPGKHRKRGKNVQVLDARRGNVRVKKLQSFR